jgi:hypothetical protein
MLRRFREAIGLVFGTLIGALVPLTAFATPSTTYWAPSVATCQARTVPHITYDTYYAKPAAYPIDTGVTIGVLPFDKLQAEVGYDTLFPGNNPTHYQSAGTSPEADTSERTTRSSRTATERS